MVQKQNNMNYLNVNYTEKGFELRFKASKSPLKVSCPSFKKPEGFISLVTRTEYDDGYNYEVSYSKIHSKSFSSKEEMLAHYRENFKGQEDKYGVDEIYFEKAQSLGFGTELSMYNEHPEFKGNNLVEKFMNYEKNR